MNPTATTDFSNTLALAGATAWQEFFRYLPQLLAAVLVLLLGSLVAKLARGLVVKLSQGLHKASLFHNTPVEAVMDTQDFGAKLTEILGVVVYWLIMLVVVQNAVSLLGLAGVATLLQRVVDYLPHVFSAAFILLVVVLLAGGLESLVKGAMRQWSFTTARIMGTLTSYVVVTIGVLAAISELGIARDFIMVLFIGVVSALALGAGLAIGLGSQDAIRALVSDWVSSSRVSKADTTVEEVTSPMPPKKRGSSMPRPRG